MNRLISLKHRLKYESSSLKSKRNRKLSKISKFKNLDSLCDTHVGSPLIKIENLQPKLIGIMSWGENCAGIGSPGIYAKIEEILEWIPETRNLFADQIL